MSPIGYTNPQRLPPSVGLYYYSFIKINEKLMGQTPVLQTTKVSAIVRQIREGLLTSSQELTSELKDIPVTDINYRQLQTIIKVYRLENYTDTNLAGKGVTAEVLRRELTKAIANQIAGTKIAQLAGTLPATTGDDGMLTARDNFTSAISSYLQDHVTEGDMCSLATRHTYTLVVEDANVVRSGLDNDTRVLVEVVEDLAASYIALQNMHPVEAVELAYERVKNGHLGVISSMLKIVRCYPVGTLECKRKSILNLVN